MLFVKWVQFTCTRKIQVLVNTNVSVMPLPWLPTIHILLYSFYINDTKNWTNPTNYFNQLHQNVSSQEFFIIVLLQVVQGRFLCQLLIWQGCIYTALIHLINKLMFKRSINTFPFISNPYVYIIFCPFYMLAWKAPRTQEAVTSSSFGRLVSW